MANASESQELITIRELSRRTGLSVSTLRRYARRGTIEALQPGGPGCKLLFRADALAGAKPPSLPEAKSAKTPEGQLPGRRPGWLMPNQSEENINATKAMPAASGL